MVIFMTTFYLIRHAEAEGNLYRRMHGQLDSMITPNGMQQIKALADRFRQIPIDVCYSSDLLRTRTTAQAICVPKGLELHSEPAFRELNVGVWDDLTFGFLQTFEPDAMMRFGKEPQLWQVEGSEPFGAYTSRFIHTMTELAQKHAGKTVAIFSHAAVMRGVIMTLFPDTEIQPSDNTCVSKLIYENGTYQLIYQNDNSHLQPEISTACRNRKMGEGFKKTDNLFWFRHGMTRLEGLQAPEAEIVYTVMAGEKPAGLLCLSEEEKSGMIAYMELFPHWRGRGRAVQLLGEAVFTFRKHGLELLRFKKPDDGSLDDLCRKMELTADETGWCYMDIRPRLRSFYICTAGKPAVV